MDINRKWDIEGQSWDLHHHLSPSWNTFARVGPGTSILPARQYGVQLRLWQTTYGLKYSLARSWMLQTG